MTDCPVLPAMNYRPLSDTGMEISEVAMGCWPIAGLASPGTSEESSLETICECFELGVNHLDTAYMYGRHGESEKLIAKAVGGRRDEMVIATKGGLHWDENVKGVHDASPPRIRCECEESLRRLETDRVDLYYLHAPDKSTPIADSAGELKRLIDEGKTRAVGVSNVNVAQMEEFARECPIAAYQPPYNMLQRQIEQSTLPWCRERGIAVLIYWPLMKGLLAGKIGRDHVFAESDSRRNYAAFQGQEWQKNHDLLDRLHEIAPAAGHTVAELVINWTLRQPGVTCALCGAKRPEQLRETAGGSGWQLADGQLAAIDWALVERGTPVPEKAV